MTAVKPVAAVSSFPRPHGFRGLLELGRERLIATKVRQRPARKPFLEQPGNNAEPSSRQNFAPKQECFHSESKILALSLLLKRQRAGFSSSPLGFFKFVPASEFKAQRGLDLPRGIDHGVAATSRDAEERVPLDFRQCHRRCVG